MKASNVKRFYGSNLQILADGLNIYIVGIEGWTLVKQLDWMVGELSRSAVKGRTTVFYTHWIYILYYIRTILWISFHFVKVSCNFALNPSGRMHTPGFLYVIQDLGKEKKPIQGTVWSELCILFFHSWVMCSSCSFSLSPNKVSWFLRYFICVPLGNIPNGHVFEDLKSFVNSCVYLRYIYLSLYWMELFYHPPCSNQPSQQPVSPCQQPGDHAAAAFLAKRRWESGAGERKREEAMKVGASEKS